MVPGAYVTSAGGRGGGGGRWAAAPCEEEEGAGDGRSPGDDEGGCSQGRLTQVMTPVCDVVTTCWLGGDEPTTHVRPWVAAREGVVGMVTPDAPREAGDVVDISCIHLPGSGKLLVVSGEQPAVGQPAASRGAAASWRWCLLDCAAAGGGAQARRPRTCRRVRRWLGPSCRCTRPGWRMLLRHKKGKAGLTC